MRSFWVQLYEGQDRIEVNLSLLKKFCEAIIRLLPRNDLGEQQVVLSKLDVTRDLRGSLIGGDDWRSLHQKLRQALELEFAMAFTDNGNSTDTCFQYITKILDGEQRIRVKFYWKSFALLTMESVQKPLGMNSNGLFRPQIRMGRALKESRNEGLTRIEITYTV